MNITLYTVPEDKKHIHKTLANAVSFSGAVRNEVDHVTPTIDIAAQITGNFNYCYIDTYGSYYFIENLNNKRNGITTLILRRDAIGTFWNSIKNCPCIVKRNANKYNMQMNDSKYEFMQKRNISVMEIGSISNNDIIVMCGLFGG